MECTFPVIYDGRIIEYDVSEFDELTLAYVIHSQTVFKRNTKLKAQLNK